MHLFVRLSLVWPTTPDKDMSHSTGSAQVHIL